MLDKGLQLFIKREDMIHPFVSGNKWRKLKYNLVEAKNKGIDTLLTFGGAYSNHIYATAAAAQEAGFNSIGVIRGDELADKPRNHTLRFAEEHGMQLHFISRESYRNKNNTEFIALLKKQFGDFYLIPEGGTNALAIKGSREILDHTTTGFDVICSSVGTGGTLAGLIVGAQPHQQILGFSALKGDFLKDEIKGLLKSVQSKSTNWAVETDYHFGGYAKTNQELDSFMESFERRHQILLDPIYTAKMLFGIYDIIRSDQFHPGQKILAIHTGGLQGRKV